MTWGRKTGGRDFAVGNKLSKGRPRLLADLAEGREGIKKWGIEWYKALHFWMKKPVEKIATDLKSPDLPACRFAAGKFLLATLNSRDPRVFSTLCRMLGVDFDLPLKIEHSLPEEVKRLDEAELDTRILKIIAVLYGDRAGRSKNS